jgi:hypothetical protein
MAQCDARSSRAKSTQINAEAQSATYGNASVNRPNNAQTVA